MTTPNSSHQRTLPKVTRPIATLLTLLAASACGRFGAPLERPMLPSTAPDVDTIIETLAANDNAIEDLVATGNLILASPQLFRGRKQCRARVRFRRPDAFDVVGRHKHLGKLIFHLTCIGPDYVLDLPVEGKRYSSQTAGEDTLFSRGEIEVAREMFLPILWTRLKPRHVELLEFDEATSQALLQITRRNAPVRRVTVQGPDWHILRAELLDRDGRVRAFTIRSDYRILDGVPFPGRIEAAFLEEETRMTLKFSNNIKLNTGLEEDLISLDWALKP